MLHEFWSFSSSGGRWMALCGYFMFFFFLVFSLDRPRWLRAFFVVNS
jgi:hypothetical protein